MPLLNLMVYLFIFLTVLFCVYLGNTLQLAHICVAGNKHTTVVYVRCYKVGQGISVSGKR